MKLEKIQKEQTAPGDEVCLSCQNRTKSNESANIKHVRVKKLGFWRLSLKQEAAKPVNRLQNTGYNFGNAASLSWLKKLDNTTRIATQKISNTVSKVTEKKPNTDSEHIEKLDLIRSRLSENFYDSPAVNIKIAKGLLRDMNLTKTDQC